MSLLPRAILLFLVLGLGLNGPVRTEASPLGEGVVAERIPEGSTLAQAGVLPGDLLRAWERLPIPPQNPDPATGGLDSPFDWAWMIDEQSMRGALRLTGERRGLPLTWIVPMGSLEDAEVRPVLPPEDVATYERGRDLLASSQAREGVDCWRWLAAKLERAGDRQKELWLTFKIARALLELRAWEESEAAFQKALAEAPDLQSRVSITFWTGELYQRQGRFADAEEVQSALLRLEESACGRSLETARSQFQLGWLARIQGRTELMTTYFEQALTTQREWAPNSREMGRSLVYLAIVSE